MAELVDAKVNTMTNEEIYEKVMGHKPNKEFGVKGSFSWNDIDALMTEAVKNCSIPRVVGQSEQLSQENERLKKACQDFINSVELKQLLRQG